MNMMWKNDASLWSMVKDNSTDDSCVCELNGYRLYDGGLSSRPSDLRASPFS